MITKKKIILVVCRGNIARSPFAEAVINRELSERKLQNEFQVISRGMQGTAVDPEPTLHPNITLYKDRFRDIKPTLDKFRVDLSTHKSKSISKDIASEAAVVLVVDEQTRTSLTTLFPEFTHKVHMLSELAGKSENVQDPMNAAGVNSQQKIFTNIYDMVTNGMEQLLAIARKY